MLSIFPPNRLTNSTLAGALGWRFYNSKKLHIQRVSQPVWKNHDQISIAMAPRSCARRSPCVNLPADPTREQDELAGQGPVWEFNAESNKAPTEALTPLEAPIPSFIPPSIENLFTKFMKVFMKMTQAQTQALAKPREQPLKARFPKTYSGKFYMDCYHFCQ